MSCPVFEKPSTPGLASSPTLPFPPSHLYPNPSPPPGLRSCLSPTRLSSCPTPTRPQCSRATSFSSDASGISMDGQWRRAKSVRWEGETEGCAVTSYHPTWSATEYDRTPLEPPSEAERTCVLPERNSRCLRTAVDCFDAVLDDPIVCESPTEEDTSHESFIVTTPVELEEHPEEEVTNENKEWEDCMERRRMMFAMRSRDFDVTRQPEFEGYRSISATLAQLLRSVGCEDVDESGDEARSENVEDETEHGIVSRLSEQNVAGIVEVHTPSLTSSAGSDSDHVLTSPTTDRVPKMMLPGPAIQGTEKGEPGVDTGLQPERSGDMRRLRSRDAGLAS